MPLLFPWLRLIRFPSRSCFSFPLCGAFECGSGAEQSLSPVPLDFAGSPCASQYFPGVADLWLADVPPKRLHSKKMKAICLVLPAPAPSAMPGAWAARRAESHCMFGDCKARGVLREGLGLLAPQ